MSDLLLAVDAGGTRTRALLCTPDGTCLGFGTGAGGNPTSSGPVAALASVADAAAGAARRAGLALADVSSVTVAMAGARALPGGTVAGALRFAGPGERLRMVSDVAATYSSGAVESAGCVVVAGTGSCAAQVRDGAVVRAVGGTGWLLGDGGSGFAVGLAVVRAVVAHLDGTGPATALTGMLLGSLGIARDASLGGEGRPAELDALVLHLYAQPPVSLARHAPLALVAAAGDVTDDVAGDAVAAGIAGRAQDDLAVLVTAVRAGGWPGPLVLGGGVAHGTLAEPAAPLSPALVTALAGADVRVVRDGAVGAAVLGLAAQGRRPDAAGLERLRASVEAARAAA